MVILVPSNYCREVFYSCLRGFWKVVELLWCKRGEIGFGHCLSGLKIIKSFACRDLKRGSPQIITEIIQNIIQNAG